MQIYLCGQCYLKGYCRRLRSRAVRADELTHRFIYDLRVYARAKAIAPDKWRPFLIDAYQNYPGLIVDIEGEEVELNTPVLDAPNIRTWFRDLCRPIEPHARLRLRTEAIERYIVMASILRAVDPVGTTLWGKDIANDNPWEAGPRRTMLDKECPYPHFHIVPIDRRE